MGGVPRGLSPIFKTERGRTSSGTDVEKDAVCVVIRARLRPVCVFVCERETDREGEKRERETER